MTDHHEWDDSSRAPLGDMGRRAADPVLREYIAQGRAAREANQRRLSALGERIRAVEQRADNIDAGQLHIIKLLERNTEITEESRDLRTAGKVITKVFLWLGSAAGALAAIVGLYFTTWGKK